MELSMHRKVKLSHRVGEMLGSGFEANISSDSGINLFSVLQLFLRRWRWIVWITGILTVLVVVWLFLTPNRFMSYATILPSAGSDKFADLKRMAGLGSFVTSEENEFELYPVILSSQTIRSAVLGRTYRFEHDGRVVDTTLTDYFGLTELDDRDEQYLLLSMITTIKTNRKTGVQTLSVETTIPEFSQAIVTAYLEELESFNAHKRKSRARENARYLKQQVSDYEAKLAVAADSLESFQMANSNWASTTNPTILKGLSRYQRDVEINARTYALLMQEHKLASLDVQKDIPIVRLLDEPTLPTRKSGPFRLRKIITVMVISLLGTLFIIIVLDALGRHSRGPDLKSYLALRNDLVRAFPWVLRIAPRVLVRPTNIDETPKVNNPNVPVGS